MNPEAHRTAKANWQEQRWTKSQNLRLARGCRKFPRASNLLFSTSDTSTSKTGFSKPLIAGLVGLRLGRLNILHDLMAVNKGCRVADLGAFLKSYTTNCGFSPPNPTTDCDVSLVSFLPRSSQTATTMPANSRVNSLMDLRFSHQRPGSKSPSRALATRTSMPCGKTRRII